jgi:DNA-binding MarR family transcriptional regulator
MQLKQEEDVPTLRVRDVEPLAASDETPMVHRLGDMPGHMIRRLHQIAVAHFGEATRACGDLTPVQYATLVAAQTQPGIDQRSLAAMIAFDRSTIGDVISRLEQRGLLRRESNRSDRRAKRVYLSQAGDELLAQMDPLVRRSQERLLAPLSEGERTILTYLMRRLVALSSDLAAEPPEAATPSVI